MMTGTFTLRRALARILFTGAAFLISCGTLEVDLEPTTQSNGRSPVDQTPFTESTTGQQVTPPAGLVTPTSEGSTVETDDGDADAIGAGAMIDDGQAVVLTGRAMTLNHFERRIQLLPEGDTPLANEFGSVNVRLSDFARIADADGEIVAFDDFGRGVKLQLTLTLQNGELVADEVIVLAPGNPPPDQNPAMSDVTGLVTPFAGSVPEGENAIQLFEIDGLDQPLDPGASVTLRWAFDGGDGSICSFQVPRPLNQTCYQDLPASGEMTVVIPAEARQAVDYTLYLGLSQRVESDTIRVALTQGLDCQDEWFYEPESLLECPAGSAGTIRAHAQEFENGLMVRVENSWLGEAPYIFMWQWADDACQGQYCSITEGPVFDPWEPGIPETDLALQPPDGFLQPTRGFGMLWRGQIEIPQMGEPRTIDGREQLGWATNQVFEYDARYQCESLNENFGIFNCHMELPDGHLAVLPGQVR